MDVIVLIIDVCTSSLILHSHASTDTVFLDYHSTDLSKEEKQDDDTSAKCQGHVQKCFKVEDFSSKPSRCSSGWFECDLVNVIDIMNPWNCMCVVQYINLYILICVFF